MALQNMAHCRFENLMIIDYTQFTDSINDPSTSLIAIIPEPFVHKFSHNDLAKAIHEQAHIDVSPQDISKYGNNFLLRMQTPEARNRLLRKDSIKVHELKIYVTTWKITDGSIPVPLLSLLTTHPINTLLGRNLITASVPEKFYITISRLPPYLCSNRVIQHLFRDTWAINGIRFHPTNLQYEVTARGRPELIPSIAHIGLRIKDTSQDMVYIWPLSYEVATEEMCGRMTPPEEREYEPQGFSAFDTEMRRGMLQDSDEDDATSQHQGDQNRAVQIHSRTNEPQNSDRSQQAAYQHTVATEPNDEGCSSISGPYRYTSDNEVRGNLSGYNNNDECDWCADPSSDI